MIGLRDLNPDLPPFCCGGCSRHCPEDQGDRPGSGTNSAAGGHGPGDGTLPVPECYSTSERTLATWLRRRREEARAGKLAQEYQDGLAVLDGWEGRPREQADENRWQERPTALVDYRVAGNDWPRHKAVITDEEHKLGIWLHLQRSKDRRGELHPQKAEALDAAVPGWRTGRQRGRRSRAQC